jgi:hypothetical protein
MDIVYYFGFSSWKKVTFQSRIAQSFCEDYTRFPFSGKTPPDNKQSRMYKTGFGGVKILILSDRNGIINLW